MKSCEHCVQIQTILDIANIPQANEVTHENDRYKSGLAVQALKDIRKVLSYE